MQNEDRICQNWLRITIIWSYLSKEVILSKKIRYKGDVTAVNKHLDSKTKESKEPRKIQEKQTKKKENIFVVFDLVKRQKKKQIYTKIKHSFYLVLALGKV